MEFQDIIKDLEFLISKRQKLIQKEKNKEIPNTLIIKHHEERMLVSQQLLEVAKLEQKVTRCLEK